MVVCNKVHRALWIIDFIVAPELRGQRSGKRLLRSALDYSTTMLILGYNDQSDQYCG
ncbi:MAG: GNAT family N-acetyltransferase, partial [Pyrinomonadaceae bacterium]